MTSALTTKNLWRKHIALPQDHGSWVFLFSPLLIGIFAAGRWHLDIFFLVVAAMAAFLSRQPATILTKVLSGRRGRRDLTPSIFWLGIYSLIGALALGWLITQGFAYLLYLAIPGVPVFLWHLWLVGRRAERRQIGVELVGTGVLALAAPAAYWVGVGSPDATGWVLFALVWLQSAASIVYAYLRLEQRTLDSVPDREGLWKMGGRAFLYTSFNLALTLVLSITGRIPALLWLPYFVQWGETIWGITHPAVKVKPTTIGFRQLAVSTIFTILFIVTWSV